MSDKSYIELLKQHTENEESNFSEFRTEVNDIKSDIRFLKENHLAHIEKDVNDVKVQLSSNTKDIDWIKWITMISLGTIITGFIGAIITMLVTK